VELTRTNGGIPATRSALDRSPQLAPGQPQQAFVRQLRDPEVALARPSTPAYPVISGAFAQVVTAVTGGKDVKAPLKRAAAAIDADIAAHDGYAAKR
jgi:multiple sugar transport system substrate-binding protein